MRREAFLSCALLLFLSSGRVPVASVADEQQVAGPVDFPREASWALAAPLVALGAEQVLDARGADHHFAAVRAAGRFGDGHSEDVHFENDHSEGGHSDDSAGSSPGDCLVAVMVRGLP
jgi:hypothetical protein